MMLKKEPRSPLRYVGGKSRGINEIVQFIPNKTRTIHSPFFGGGSVELVCANNDMVVHGYDRFKPIVEFWQCLLKNSKKLASLVREYYPLTRSAFYELQKTHHQYTSKYERAAIYFVLNRSSFSGTTMSGGMSPNHPRFTISSIERLENFSINNLQIEQADFTKSITNAKSGLLYLDPPYLLDQQLYGRNGDMHRSFDHEKLAELLHKKNKWILSYNDSKKIHEIYDGYYFHYPKWKYGMSNDKDSREVIILSHDISEMI